MVIRNPRTGEERIPGRADRPIHPNYIAAGFTERVELTHGDIKRMEKQGLIHEASNYDSNGTETRDTGSV